MGGEGGDRGFASASDGSVEVDSNTGTAEDLQAELATEVAVTEADGRRSSKPAVPALGLDDEEAAGDDEAAGKPAAPVVGKAAAAAKPGDKTAAGKKKSIQARIDDLTRERYTTVRERDAAYAERDTLRAELETLKAGKPADKPADGKPAVAAVVKPAQARPAAWAGEKVAGVALGTAKFPKYGAWLEIEGNDGELEDWIEARDGWLKAKDARVAADVQEVAQHSERFTKTAATFNERMAPVLEAEPDFYDKIDPRLTETPAASALPKGVNPTFGNFLVEQVVVSAHPKELLVHLSDQKVVRRLMTLQPDQIVREIMKFELGIGDPAARRASGPAGQAPDDEDDEDADASGSEAAAATVTSRAHPPAKPVRGSSHEHSSPDAEPGDDASDDEWFRWEQRRTTKAARG